jgi:hypothetical protein
VKACLALTMLRVSYQHERLVEEYLLRFSR